MNAADHSSRGSEKLLASSGASTHGRRSGVPIRCRLTANLKEAFRQWFVDSAKRRIPLRVRHYAEKIGVLYNSVVISDMKYRWGSCTPNENLSFNWRLIKAPMHVIDYVVVHELAHLLEHNHGPRFWQHVKTQIPNFEASKNWLKGQGQCLEDDF